MEKFDLAIIGAGPGGNYAALSAANAGMVTVVLEEHGEIGKPVHCGECLSKEACDRLGLELPEEVVSMDVSGVRLVFPNGTASYIREMGYTLEKDRFEKWLALEATKAGAAYRLKNRVVALERKDDGWEITTTAGSYFAYIVIDASGVDSVASRLLGINEQQQTVVGLQYEMEIESREEEAMLDFFLWPRLAPNGYLWIIPKKGRRANVGLVTSSAPKSRALLEKFLEERGIKDKKRNKAFGGRIPAAGPIASTFDDGLMIIGDAAGFTSPMFEGGTSLAMTSGKFAVEVAVSAFAKKDFSKAALSAYERKWKSAFPDYSKLVEGKKAMYRFTESELNTIASLIPRDLTKISSTQKVGIGLNVLLRAPLLLAKGFVPAMETLGKSRAKHFGW